MGIYAGFQELDITVAESLYVNAAHMVIRRCLVQIFGRHAKR